MMVRPIMSWAVRNKRFRRLDLRKDGMETIQAVLKVQYLVDDSICSRVDGGST
jgi:hypothetical protein